MRLRHIVICGLPGSKTFFQIINSSIFFGGGRGVLEHKMCVFSLQLLSETFLILRTERDMMKNVYRFACKVPVVLVRF